MKRARETNVWIYFCFFSRVKNIFLDHFYLKFMGHFEVFSGRFSIFFSVCILFVSGWNFRILWYFYVFNGETSIFFLWQRIFFFSGRICCFFLRYNFSSRAVFNIFSRAENWKFSREDFFFSGKKKTLIGAGGALILNLQNDFKESWWRS